MNPKETGIVHDAVAIISNMEGQVENVVKRGSNANRFFVAESKQTYHTEAVRKTLSSEVIVALTAMGKSSKAVAKDLAELYKEGSDAKRLAKYADIKAFRVKATKLLDSSKAFEGAGMKLKMSLHKADMGAGYPGCRNVDVKAVVDSMANFSKYYNAFRIALARS